MTTSDGPAEWHGEWRTTESAMPHDWLVRAPAAPVVDDAYTALFSDTDSYHMHSLQGVASSPDDPTPTTGGPHDYHFPDGCVCHIREDIDYGEQYVAPRGGCPVHSCTCLAAAMGGLHTIDCLHTRLNRPPVEMRRGRPLVDGPAV